MITLLKGNTYLKNSKQNIKITISKYVVYKWFLDVFTTTMLKIMLLFVFVSTLQFTEAQDISERQRIEEIKTELNSLDTVSPGLNEVVSFTVSNIPIQELVRNLAKLNQINITIDQDIKVIVTNNFAEVPAKELIVFLCKQYGLEIEITGSIISLHKYSPPKEEEKPYIPKKPKISYNASTNSLSMDLYNDSLYMVTKEITTLSGKNVIFTPGLKGKRVSTFIDNSGFDQALENFALANNMKLNVDDGFYILGEEESDPNPKTTSRNSRNRNTRNNTDGHFEIHVINRNNISANATNASIGDILSNVSTEAGVNYFIYSKLDETRSIQVKNVKYEEFLEQLLNGSKYTFKLINGIFLIGDRNTEKLRLTKVIQLKSRTVVDISNVIPSKLSEDVEIKEFPDLNSLIICGSSQTIEELELFIKSIDKVVPMVLIEVLIVDSRSNRSLSTGITAGLSDEPVNTSGTFMPGVDVTLSSESLNKLISSFNGYGWFNMGKVTPNFYVSLKALESNGIVKVRSTPKLSTLNGHEAEISIGNTEYYLEQTNSVIGTQNPQNITSQNYKPVQVDFTLKINPIVSGNEQVTLDIVVEQSDFTARISKEAPPGSISRSFTSLIRIKNEEMVLLGGLEEKSVNESYSGIPILSRIPILKWIFSSREKENSFEKLNIFIKPTIIY